MLPTDRTGVVSTGALVVLVSFLASATSLARGADAGLAKVTAIQNQVETKAASAPTWAPATEGASLSAQDRIRTGPASRASILYSDQTLHRLNEKSEVEILPPAGGGSGIVKILSGQSYFTTRTPKDFGRVQTPTVTAAIKGTEFAVSVAEDGGSVITMIEGTVEAENEFGRVTVTRGEEAVTAPGKAPQRRIAVRPRDAVAWSLYYPPVLGGSDRGNAKLDSAAAALAAGQVNDAGRTLDEVRSSEPGNAAALALSSVAALAANRNDQARQLADQALAANGSSPAALLARSYVAQADFDLDRARQLAEKAAAADPQNAEALARAAELRLASGDYAGARKAAAAAVDRQPNSSRALAVLGFVELASYHTKLAASWFDKAVEADSGFPLAHAGRGIARIRQGKLAQGREELQTAITLDPGESLYRSYLGKAYYEEYRSKEAAKELAAAKDLDPNDPTPWLYNAILLENDNRPIEALRDLNGAIERNDNRAVYRSRLLLDEDRAVRGTDLARIYDDLGFDALGLVAARRSADQDQANFSSHLFLAGNYRNLPGYASSFLSETLQARIYQPVGANAARPDYQGGTVAFNEYTQLFDRPRYRGFIGGSYGTTDTDFNPPSLAIDDSHNWTGDVLGTYNGDRVAASVGVRKLNDDGFRINDKQDITAYNTFVEVAPTERDTVQLNAVFSDQTTGDIQIQQFPTIVRSGTIDTRNWNVGLGWHHRASAAVDYAFSAIWNDTHQIVTDSGFTSSEAHLTGPQVEGQVVYRTPRTTWIGGAGAFTGNFDAGAAGEAPEHFGGLYGYGKIRGMGPVEITAGLAAEAIDTPVGLLPPNNSFILPTDVDYYDWHLSPKLGVTATFASGTTLRAAAFSKMASPIGRLQTLEPTQVSGFNQFFEDVGGTRSRNYGLGIDQGFGSVLFFGASWMKRELAVPEASCPTPSPIGGCAFQPGSVLFDRFSHDNLASVYVNALIGKRVSASLDWDLDKRHFDTTTMSPLGFFQDRFETQRVKPQVRVFLPIGFFASLWATYYDQQVQQFLVLGGPPHVEQSSFWISNAEIGWRLPRRIGAIALTGTNLADKQFRFYEQALQEQVIPARRITLRADFAF